MSTPLTIDLEDLPKREKRSNYTIAVIGCESTGVYYACCFAEAGFRVICTDIDPTAISIIKKGKVPFLTREMEVEWRNHLKTKHLTLTSDIEDSISRSNIIILATSLKIDERRKLDYSNIEKNCKLIGSNLRRGSLIITTVTAELGFTGELIKETLENTTGFKAGTDFGLAYSPFWSLCDPSLGEKSKGKWIVAALDRVSMDAASMLLEIISKESVVQIDSIRTAEAVALFEAVQRNVNVALANELAVLCEGTGVDYSDVWRSALQGTPDALPFPRLSSEEAQSELYILREIADNLNLKLPLSATARALNEQMIKHGISLIREAIKASGKPLRGARISLLGVTCLPDVKVSLKPAVRKLAKMLEAKGARITIFDPYSADIDLADLQRYCRKSLSETVEGSDCLVIITAHDQFKHLSLKKLGLAMRRLPAVVDFERILDPDKVEEEGFIYRGLGRGVKAK